MSTFADLGVPEALTAALAERGISETFPIQAATLPDALAGADVCGRAPTGSGKTLAFGLPLLAGLAAARAAGAGRSKPGRPQALVLLPTRELAAQVADVLSWLGAGVGVRVSVVYGGVGYQPQRRALSRGVDLLVACPGRLEDLIAQGDVDLSDVHWAVLDEADRMADMGFLPAVKRLLDQISADRQLLLFSATLDGDVDVIVRRYLDQPKRHSVVTDEELSGTVLHHWWALGREDRTALTAELVRSHAPAVVFCRTKHGADRLTKRLETAGVTAVAVHGDKSQPQRDRAIASFAAGRVDALVATDVAARGIHIDGVACVIHFDPPADPKDYTHRSGRTGRAGADGVVVTLVTPDVAKAVTGLQRALGMPKGTARPDVAGLPAAAPRPEPKPLSIRTDRPDRTSGGRPPGGKPGSSRPRRPRSDDGRGWERRGESGGRDESRRDGFPGRSGQGAGGQGRSSSGIQRNHRAGQPGGPGQRQGQGGGRRRTAGR